MRPFGPCTTSCTASVVGTQEKTKLACSPTSAGDFAGTPPIFSKSASELRRKPTTRHPLLMRFSQLGGPIFPIPMNPILSMPVHLFLLFSDSGRLAWGVGAHRLLLPRLLVGIDQRAGLGLGRPDDRLRLPVAELIQVVGLRVLDLGPDHARLRPFAVLAEREIAGHGFEARLVHVGGELVVIEAL